MSWATTCSWGHGGLLDLPIPVSLTLDKRLHFQGLTSYRQLVSFGAERQKILIWYQIMGSILRHDVIFKFTHQVCITRVRSSACYSAHKNGGMVVAGGCPNAAIESAVARCLLRYHALFSKDSLPFFHAKQINTLALSRKEKKKKEKQHHRILRAWLDRWARGFW